MSRTAWWAALGGLAAGAASILLLPEHTLFRPTRGAAEEAMAGGQRWACPMMDFIGYRPGRCPVCGMEMGPVTAGELTREQQRRMGLETVKVTEGPARITVRAHGVADYDHRFTRVVIPRVAGRIIKRHDATFGCCQEVDEGVAVVDLYSPEVIAAQGELEAAVKLGDRGLVEALRQRFARWHLTEVADGIVAGGGIQDVVTIRTPFGGQVVVGDMQALNEALEVGREVMPDQPLLRLVDPDRMVLVVQVPEMEARFVSEGQPVRLDSDTLGPLHALTATVNRVAQEVNPDSRTREVRIYVTGARPLLSPGALVSARIEGVLGPDLQPADPLLPARWGRFALVPKAAVLSTGVRHLAWRVAGRESDGRIRFEPAPLALGPRLEDEHGNDLYIVRAGLQPGDEVAAQGAFLVDSQAQLAGTPSLLNPRGAEQPAPSSAHPASP